MQELTQHEADRLLQTEKHYRGKESYHFPADKETLPDIELMSSDGRAKFILNVSRKGIDLQKFTFANRAQIFTLARVDLLQGGRHLNPDQEIITGPHIHYYREGYGDKWAFPLPESFRNCQTPYQILQQFMTECHIVTRPRFEQRLF
ncbi:MAG: DUF6978 family protein [Thermoguttaceae bacterium]